MIDFRARVPALLALAAILAGCARSQNTPDGVGALPDVRSVESQAATGGKIQHVIVIIQENRSVDDLFQGYPKADTRSYGYNASGKKITLGPIPLETTWDIYHDLSSFLLACNGAGKFPGTQCRMNGFNKEPVTCGLGPPACPRHPQYGYVPASETKPYFAMASQYVLADHMFTSMIDISSFTSHQYIIAGQAESTVNFPSSAIWGCDGGYGDKVATITAQRALGPQVRPCLPSTTLADELDAAKLPWGYYTARIHGNGNMWNAFQAVKHIRYGPDWKKDIHMPATTFFKAIDDGELPAVSWITPTCQNSDHAGCASNHGPMWVASLVNAIGKSKYWKSSAIFLMWDEDGGWYDHVAPKMLDYDGLGFRVPLLIISPYAKQGYVSHLQYEHGSILKFTEDVFGLKRLAASDARATSPADDCFDFNQAPRPFAPIPAALGRSYFENEPVDPRIPDAE